MFDLNRFTRAQDRTADGFNTALAELQVGQKRSHWIWYIFPQFAGLGHSAMAVRYGLQGPGEATAYLRDPILRERLLLVTKVVAERLARQPPPALDDLMGSEIDAVKLVSSLTLFRGAACRLQQVEPGPELVDLGASADAILHVAAAQGWPACEYTLQQLAS